MKTAANQKVVKVNKALMDENNLYTKINIEIMFAAMRTLKDGSFKVWLYLAKNQNNHKFAFSSKDAAEVLGISQRTVQRAIEELIDNNYLVQKEEGSNQYDFYENPKPLVEMSITTHKEEFNF